jgi:hypothetical protein
MRRIAIASGVLLIASLLAVPLAFAPGDAVAPASAEAVSDIPARALVAYQREGGRCRGLRWELLAGIGKVESDHGRHGGGTIEPDGTVVPPILGPMLDGSGAGGNTTAVTVGRFANRWGLGLTWQQALGPMQFLPGTFEAWAVDADGDGTVNPHDIDDAIATAASYLCGSVGEISDERSAVRRYNQSDAYVDEVLQWAARYATSAPPLTVRTASVEQVLADPNLTIYADGRQDIALGRVDQRVLQVLVAIADWQPITVTSLVTGHPRCAVTGQAEGPDCAVSNHYFGRAADIGTIAGATVSARNALAIELMHRLAALPAGLRPDEIGGPVDTGEPGVFTNEFHADHIHVGFGD